MTPMTRKQKQEAARRLATMNSAIGATMRLSAEAEYIHARDVDEWLDDLARVEAVASELGGFEEREILKQMPLMLSIKEELLQRSSRHRHNPPLPEHMAHDSLDEIAEGLALRFVAKPKGRRMIYFLRSLLNEVNRQAVARGSDTIPGDTGFRPVAQRELGSLHAEAAMLLDFIHQELE